MLPSETESFGLAALEAMASSVPVVASNTGGIPEVVEDGNGGHLHAVGDIDAMAELALKVFSNKSLAEISKVALSPTCNTSNASYMSPLMLQIESLYWMVAGQPAFSELHCSFPLEFV